MVACAEWRRPSTRCNGAEAIGLHSRDADDAIGRLVAACRMPSYVPIGRVCEASSSKADWLESQSDGIQSVTGSVSPARYGGLYINEQAHYAPWWTLRPTKDHDSDGSSDEGSSDPVCSGSLRSLPDPGTLLCRGGQVCPLKEQPGGASAGPKMPSGLTTSAPTAWVGWPWPDPGQQRTSSSDTSEQDRRSDDASREPSPRAHATPTAHTTAIGAYFTSASEMFDGMFSGLFDGMFDGMFDGIFDKYSMECSMEYSMAFSKPGRYLPARGVASGLGAQ